MSSALGKPFDAVRDGENNPIEFDVAYPLGAHPEAAVAEARRRHGDDIHLLPISGSSAGGGIFQAAARPPGVHMAARCRRDAT